VAVVQWSLADSSMPNNEGALSISAELNVHILKLAQIINLRQKCLELFNDSLKEHTILHRMYYLP